MNFKSDIASALGYALANTDDLRMWEDGVCQVIDAYQVSVIAHIFSHKLVKGPLFDKDLFIHDTITGFKKAQKENTNEKR